MLGVQIDALSWHDAVDRLLGRARAGQSRYVAISECGGERVARCGLSAGGRRGGMATPDGAPVAWMLRKLGFAGQPRICGLDLMWALNPRNHERLTFDEAKAVLLALYALTREDLDAKGEQRFVSLGMGSKGRILLVVWTLRGDNPRLISAWKANQPQRRRHEQQF